MAMETLSRGVDAMITSQNLRLDFTPVPRSDAQTGVIGRVTIPRLERCSQAAPTRPVRKQQAATARAAADSTDLP